MLVSTTIPTNSELRLIRQHLGLSQMELASALGFRLPRGELTIREWERDPEFHPTPLAWCALRYMLMVVEIYRETDAESSAYAKISRLLPEALR